MQNMNRMQQVLQTAYQNFRELAVLAKDSEIATRVKDALSQAYTIADEDEKRGIAISKEQESLIAELRSQIDSLSNALSKQTKDCPCDVSSASASQPQ